MMWPEIPPDRRAGSSLRSLHARTREHSASRTLSGAHITRDFYPRDVRMVLNHSQAWDPRPPLPLVSLYFTRLYRDYARYFFWPIAGLILINLLVLALGQGLEGRTKDALEIGVFAFLGALYLITLRSPVLTPVDYWHHLNHLAVAGGLATVWLVTFGAGGLWYIAPVLVVPSGIVLLSTVLIREVSGFAGLVIWPLRFVRGMSLWVLNRRAHYPPRLRRTGLIRGVKPAHEYTAESELFYRHPRDGKPIHRADREEHWSAYARVIAREGDRYPVTAYARVLDSSPEGVTAIQYWFCFYYNDWANEHEGDWESVLVLVRGAEPVAVAVSTHEAGDLRDWQHVESIDGRPVLYVAAGSHAFYFEPGAFLAERAVAGLRVTSIDATLFGKQVLDYVDFAPDRNEAGVIAVDQVVLIPDPDPESKLWGHVDHDPACAGDCPFNFEWLNFQGHWGAVGVSLAGGLSGPRGPAESGLPWDNPYLWADTVCRPCLVCAEDARHPWAD